VDKIERFGDDGIEENTDDIGVVEVDIYSDDQEEVRHQVDDENLGMMKLAQSRQLDDFLVQVSCHIQSGSPAGCDHPDLASHQTSDPSPWPPVVWILVET